MLASASSAWDTVLECVRTGTNLEDAGGYECFTVLQPLSTFSSSMARELILAGDLWRK